MEVESTVLPDIGLPDAQLLNEPVVLWVPVVVLSGPQSVGDPLDTVHYRTSKIVGGVDPVIRETGGFIWGRFVAHKSLCKA